MHKSIWAGFGVLFLTFSTVCANPMEKQPYVIQPTPSYLRPFQAPEAQKFLVPRQLPLMDFQIPETYAGLLDISESPQKQTSLFFWLVPSSNRETKNLILWTNGGPGCSSMLGAFTENGPVSWTSKGSKPIKNPNSWHTRAHLLYFEHPAPTGFSTGNVNITSEAQVAEYTFRFLKAFLKVFPELLDHNLYLSGESYGGYYISYMADYIYAKQAELRLQLEGTLFISALFANFDLQASVALYPYVEKRQDIFKFNSTFMSYLKERSQKCGYTDYYHKYLVFPAVKTPSPPFGSLRKDCDLWTQFWNAGGTKLDYYNIKRSITMVTPLLTNPQYFDRPDVRKAFNVHNTIPWIPCSESKLVFNGGDFHTAESSAPPAEAVLPSIIERNKRTVMVHGKLDAILPFEGAILGVQNMSWSLHQGFQRPLTNDFKVNGVSVGKHGTERGFTLVVLDEAGHLIPRDQPEASLAVVDYLIGDRTTL
ncbi:hypothetical protein O181_017305 [Austropuccinia psidii MF-1]|uniref:Carboxypeptidase n=1 Tax=Austropuccinia psidii MF-1 TaxID=1389203 RepID=A0A9Q3C6I4_9BASI|nr:hypothetical protein [Austropuccinia psidii MF-1]